MAKFLEVVAWLSHRWLRRVWTIWTSSYTIVKNVSIITLRTIRRGPFQISMSPPHLPLYLTPSPPLALPSLALQSHTHSLSHKAPSAPPYSPSSSPRSQQTTPPSTLGSALQTAGKDTIRSAHNKPPPRSSN